MTDARRRSSSLRLALAISCVLHVCAALLLFPHVALPVDAPDVAAGDVRISALRIVRAAAAPIARAPRRPVPTAPAALLHSPRPAPPHDTERASPAHTDADAPASRLWRGTVSRVAASVRAAPLVTARPRPRVTPARIAAAPQPSMQPDVVAGPPVPSPSPTAVPTVFDGLFSQNYAPALDEPTIVETLRAALGGHGTVSIVIDERGRASDVRFDQPDTQSHQADVRATLLLRRYVHAECDGLPCAGTLEIRY